ncbi:hypothetical protein GGR54DRAFT_634043 [Hypoxylon sp. NC1633]|nr:hypothetical protein GGR54DRAFT_634043 [Hypoxylon sp. NC1633]
MAPPETFPPLSFDRVTKGSSIASASSILFTIPVEILQLIIGYVASDKTHLASLALVNSDCRQLARSCQFNSIVLDYGPIAIQVLAMLQKEASQRYRSPDRMTVSPSLGVCVRQLIINSERCWPIVQSFLPLDHLSGRELDDNELAIVSGVGSILSEHLDHLYWPAVLLVIPTLPNLQSITMDSGELDGHFRRIPRVRPGRNSCPLETLSIDAVWEFHFAHNHPNQLDPSAFYQSLLEPCHSSLRSLQLTHRDFLGRNDKPISFDIEFPKLKTLQIGWHTSIDGLAASSLVREGLSSLSIPYDHLSGLGQIHTLHTLVLYGNKRNGSVPTHFLKSNIQIRSLEIRYGHTDAFLRDVIQSLLHHENLQSLSLTWRENDIPEASLDKLSLLSQVEVLHISAGEQAGWPTNWFADHSIIGRYLRRLVNIRRLIISRDTYVLQPGEEHLDPMRYYDLREPGSDLWATHQARMLDHATTYVRLLPRLAFIHIGKVRFTVKKVCGVRTPIITGSTWHGERERDGLNEFDV